MSQMQQVACQQVLFVAELRCVVRCKYSEECETKNKYKLFIFLTGNQINSVDIPLRMKVVFSKLKQLTIQGRLFRFEFSSL